jgi:spoIIIJ-associated protein
MRELEMSAKTVEDAVQAACEALGVDRDDISVSYEVLAFPERKLFKTIPARVKVTVTEPEPEMTQEAAKALAAEAPKAEKTAPADLQAAVKSEAPATEAPKAPVAAENAAPAGNFPAPEADAVEEPLDLAADERLTAAVEYLKPIFEMLGAQNVSFTAVRKGAATILKVDGEHMGGLIGRRGETMESLSYLASLVINRMPGDYIKLGLDVGGYRNKREEDLTGLATRIAEKVKRTGYCYEMEPMNPYERHIIHAAVSGIEGVRSESKGEGQDRRVVIYSTDPNASNLPDRSSRGGRDSHGPRGGYGRRNDRGSRDFHGGHENRGGRDFHSRSGGYGSGASRGGYAPHSSVPEREFANTKPEENLKPQAPAPNTRIHDDDTDIALFGKIEL